MRILLAEDDRQLGESLANALTLDHYVVDWVRRGTEVSPALSAASYDALILDIGLPGLSGLDVVRNLRRKGDQTPVMLLTARDAVADRINGLDMGADDYLGKPFDMDELFARLRSLLRRSGGMPAAVLMAGEMEFHTESREVVFRQQRSVLPAKEMAVLEMLARNRGRFVTKARLEESTYRWGEEIGSNTVEVYISHLRKRFGSETIETLRGVGYRLVV
ncbi:MAG TPA: response regulator transcription factor [Spongiibacteraceae bacterium]|nr:response regulator transcription factor [Spongiibacteraceae bacterium]